MPDTNSSKDDKKDHSGPIHVKASTRHVKSGSVVNVRAHDVNRDEMGESLKQEHVTIPLVAVPGKYPNGRSTPGTVAVQKAEAVRQDAELAAALKEVEQLKAQLKAVNEPQDNQNSPDQPTLATNYGYGPGVGDVADSGGFSGAGAAQ